MERVKAQSSHNNVSGNTCYKNHERILVFLSSNHNTITNNNFSYNYGYGILLADESNDNEITGNILHYSDDGCFWIEDGCVSNTKENNNCREVSDFASIPGYPLIILLGFGILSASLIIRKMVYIIRQSKKIAQKLISN